MAAKHLKKQYAQNRAAVNLQTRLLQVGRYDPVRQLPSLHFTNPPEQAKPAAVVLRQDIARIKAQQVRQRTEVVRADEISAFLGQHEAPSHRPTRVRRVPRPPGCSLKGRAPDPERPCE
ncbi:hypothetical protein SS50377_20748 [Spironucleus salmonicida]|uniref:Uncharacterized protein n=1 Tax=Spironucleus salmonicida TaxID=348837 RepID=A0A9P8LZS2_9EUKA|nr:hypothetical protein SS50377_20748 [Spironucleus salmonicida]